MKAGRIDDVIGALDRHPAGRVIVLPAGQERRVELTFADLRRRTAAAAARLAAAGVTAGAPVGILAANSVDWISVDLACIALGAISVPFDPAYPWGPGDAFADEWELRLLVTDGDAGSRRAVPLSAVIGGAASLPPRRRFRDDDVVTVKFSSGTSAGPKAVKATARHVNHMMAHVAAMFPMGPDDLFLVIAPLSTWLQRCMVHLCILQGASVCLARPDRVTAALARERPSIVLGVPRLLETVHDVYRRRHRSGSPARLADVWGGRMRYLWTGSAPIDRSVLDAYAEGGVPVFEGYGMTETGLIAKNHPGRFRIGSVGPLFPDTELRTDDDGELLVRSDYHANHGYWRGEGDAFRAGGWIATGDVGHLDADGFLHLDGRAKDAVVLTNGYKVFPAAVEERLRRQPAIADCAVFGHGRGHLVAVVVPAARDLDDLTIERALIESGRTARPHERVLAFVRADGFTAENGLRTANGKLLRREIASRFGAALAAVHARQ